MKYFTRVLLFLCAVLPLRAVILQDSGDTFVTQYAPTLTMSGTTDKISGTTYPSNLLEVKTSAGYDRLPYIEFNLAAYAADTISNASLSLTFAPTPVSNFGTFTAGVTWTFQVYALTTNNNLDVNTLTWANSSETFFSGTDTSVAINGTLVGTFNVTASGAGITEVISGSALDSYLDSATGTVAFAIKRTGGNSDDGIQVLYNSKGSDGSGKNAPTLTFTAVPEPGSLALFALALILIPVAARCGKKFTARQV